MLTKNIEFKNFIKSKKYKSTKRFLANIKKKFLKNLTRFYLVLQVNIKTCLMKIVLKN